MGGSNQMVFLVGTLVLAQGSAAVPILVLGLLVSWAAAAGWIELALMWPERVGGISATCAEAFKPCGGSDVVAIRDHGAATSAAPTAS